MLICFDMKKFSIVTGLRCHPPFKPLSTVTPTKKSNTYKTFKLTMEGKKGKTSTPKTCIKTATKIATKINKGKDKVNKKNQFVVIID